MIRVGRSYRKKPPDREFDVLVIGSGVGGLASAAVLGRALGKRVAVLERHYMPGGFTHVYRRRGYEWDVGVHYVGGMGSTKSPTLRLLNWVTDGSLEWAPMGELYDRILLGERTYDLVSGRDAFRDRLHGYFPRETGAVDRYLELMDQVARSSNRFFAEKALPPLVARLAGPFLRAPFLRWAGRTTRTVLDELGAGAELQGVLTGQFGDYGLPPAQSSFAMQAMLAKHYLYGGYYPVGGSSRIAAAIAPVIQQAGGEVFYQAEVERVLVQGRRAVGVRMTDGRELHAPIVISDAGVHATYRSLLDAETAAGFGLDRRAEQRPPSVGHLCLYLGFRHTAAELGLPKHNLWIYPGPDHDASVAAFVADPEAPLPLVYASFPSAKDPEFEAKYPGRATIELITLAPWERFERWSGTPWRERGTDYEELKAALAARMLDRLDGALPGVRDKIDYMEVSTPLSTRHFAGYARGEIYGLEHTPERFADRTLRPETPIRGLYLTGQDMTTCGVVGALMSGYLTASSIARRNLMARALGG